MGIRLIYTESFALQMRFDGKRLAFAKARKKKKGPVASYLAASRERQEFRSKSGLSDRSAAGTAFNLSDLPVSQNRCGREIKHLRHHQVSPLGAVNGVERRCQQHMSDLMGGCPPCNVCRNRASR